MVTGVERCREAKYREHREATTAWYRGGVGLTSGLERSSLHGMEGSETPLEWDGRKRLDGQAEAANLVGSEETRSPKPLHSLQLAL